MPRLGARHRPRGPRPAAHASEALLRLRDDVRRATEHACVPDCLGLPGALPVLNARGGADGGEGRARARLHGPDAKPLRAEELLLSGPAEGLPDQPVRRAVQRPRCTVDVDVGSRGRTPPRSARASSRIHMEEDAGKNVHELGGELDRRPEPRRHPAHRDRGRAGSVERRRGRRVPAHAARHPRVPRGQRRQPRGGLVPLRRQRVDPARRRGEARHARRAEEHQLLQVRREGDRRRDRAPEARSSRAAAGSSRRRAAGTRRTARRSRCAARRRPRTTATSPSPTCRRSSSTTSSSRASRAELPELPRAKRERFVRELGLTPYAAQVLTQHPRVAAFFEEAATLHLDAAHASRVANFVQSEVLRDVTTQGQQADLPDHREAGRRAAAPRRQREDQRQAGEGALRAAEGTRPTSPRRRSSRELGMAQVSDPEAIEAVCAADHRREPEAGRGSSARGKTALFGFFVGQVMKATKGSANPQLVNDTLKRLLGTS